LKEISNNFKNMIKEAWYILEAKKIIGKWGYEEKAWWNPIAKALKKTDIEAYARGLHDGQIFGRKNEKLENNSHKHPCGNTPHCFCGKCSPTYNDTPQEWESLYPLDTFTGETKKELIDLITYLLSTEREKAYHQGFKESDDSGEKVANVWKNKICPEEVKQARQELKEELVAEIENEPMQVGGYTTADAKSFWEGKEKRNTEIIDLIKSK